MKAIKTIMDEDNVFMTHVFKDLVVNEALASYTFPSVAFFFSQIRLEEYNILNHNNGMLYVFFDLSGYYSEEYGEYSLVPMIYYTNDLTNIILDDFNEMHDLDNCLDMYLLDGGIGFDITDDSLVIKDLNLLKFFLNFDNDIKKVIIEIKELKENKFTEGVFKIIK